MRTLASRVKGYRLRTGLAMNVSTTLSSIDGRERAAKLQQAPP